MLAKPETLTMAPRSGIFWRGMFMFRLNCSFWTDTRISTQLWLQPHSPAALAWTRPCPVWCTSGASFWGPTETATTKHELNPSIRGSTDSETNHCKPEDEVVTAVESTNHPLEPANWRIWLNIYVHLHLQDSQYQIKQIFTRHLKKHLMTALNVCGERGDFSHDLGRAKESGLTYDRGTVPSNRWQKRCIYNYVNLNMLQCSIWTVYIL